MKLTKKLKLILFDAQDLVQRTPFNQNMEKLEALVGSKSGLATLDGEGLLDSAQRPRNTMTATLQLSAWVQDMEDGSWSQTLSVPGAGPQATTFVDCVQTKADIKADIDVLSSWECINAAKDDQPGQITFYCYGKKPYVDVPINLVVIL